MNVNELLLLIAEVAPYVWRAVGDEEERGDEWQFPAMTDFAAFSVITPTAP
jgi:hypothetical protein